MPVGGKLKLIKSVLYRLKRDFGCPLSVYSQTPQTIDLTTGRACMSRTVIEITRAIVLPSKIHRGFSYPIDFLKANSNFTYGGIYTDADRQIILDRKDLNGLELNTTDQFYIVYQGKRYELKVIEEFEFNLAYVITMTRVDGAIVNQVHNITIRDELCFDDETDVLTPTEQELHIHDQLVFTGSVTLGPMVHNRTIDQKLQFWEVANGSM